MKIAKPLHALLGFVFVIALATPALASHGRDPLYGLAWELENKARFLHRHAEETAHHGTYGEARALARLHELEGRARHFNKELRYRGPYSGHVQRDFSELREVYLRARRALPGLHAYAEIEVAFCRIDELMRDLDHAYGVRTAHRRYGHDGRYRYDDEYGDDEGYDDAYGRARFDVQGERGAASVRVDWQDRD